MYHARGIRVTQILSNNELECIQEEIRSVNLNVLGTDEHVGDIEQSIRSIKEDTRFVLTSMQYK